MTGIVTWLGHLPALWLCLVVGVMAALESAALVGLLVPGETALLVGGVAAANGRVAVPLVMVVATIAAVVGDSIGFELGRRFGPHVRASRLGRRVGDARWERADRFIDRHGGPAILLCRWVGPLRALVPSVAGMGGMPYRRFFLWNVVGAVTWAPTVVGLGFLGSGSIGAVERILGRASAIAAMAAVITVVLVAVRVRRRREASA